MSIEQSSSPLSCREFLRKRLNSAEEKTPNKLIQKGTIMLKRNQLPAYRQTLDSRDTAVLGKGVADTVEAHMSQRDNYAPTPILSLPALATKLGIAAVQVKDEGQRLGLGSFKALGGSYAVVRLVLEAAEEQLGRSVDLSELTTQELKLIAGSMTFGCATDGNHGRSVAMGAALVGAKAAIFIHSGVSSERVDAIARYGAEIIRVDGNYDDAVEEAARTCLQNKWTILSDTSWPGYERIPSLVMQGYTLILHEVLRNLTEPPTHVFLQAGVGGFAAAIAGQLEILYGNKRPLVIVVEPARAACVFASAAADRLIKVPQGEPTIMAMLECYEPSLVAWRILSRCADAFMTVDEPDAIDAMRRFAYPVGHDPVIIAGESGAVGLAGLLSASRDSSDRSAIGLGQDSRVLLINTEGATDLQLYRKLVGQNVSI